MTDRELQEFSIGIQVQMMRKIDRIERHLMRQEEATEYMSKNIHQDEVYKDIYSKYEAFLSQLRSIKDE